MEKRKKRNVKAASIKQKQIPYHHKPEDMSLDEWQAGLRKQFAQSQDFIVKNLSSNPVFSDFHVFNPASGKTYRVAIRSAEPGLNFCSCPDFKVNLLGTCKHIEYLLDRIKNTPQTNRLLKRGNIQFYSSISLKYGADRKVYLRIGENNRKEMMKLAMGYFDSQFYLKSKYFDDFEKFLDKALQLDSEFRCYSDAVDFIIDVRSRNKRISRIEAKYGGMEAQIFKGLINANLYPYQQKGVLFAAKAGRCLIADDMGLGKTIQAIAATEVFAQEFSADKALIICPTSLKYQWKAEIEKFTGKPAMVIEGSISKRAEQYKTEDFYKITSYNSVKNDLRHIGDLAPDVVILDEAQKIKNWKTKTAQSVKSINSEFALVLTGTPIENRLEELHSLVEFVDRYKLGAMFRFLNSHQVLDDNGKVIGYKNLNQISKALSQILIRRRKSEVLQELPERVDKNFFVPATPEQMDIHNAYSDTVARLVNKWRKHRFLSEPDRKRLLLSLSCMRMVCDSTYILDQQSRYDTKVNELRSLLEDIFEEKNTKVVIFSQWERMTRLISYELEQMGVKYEYLHGGVPSVKRKDLLQNFSNNRNSRVFLSTDAGGVGLNLQSAEIVINMDIPWNPAVLEQRVARVHRLGQGSHVRVINFITKDSIEERILNLLNFKKSLLLGVLDDGDDQVFLNDDKFKKIMDVVDDLSNPPFEDIAPVADEASESEVYGKDSDKEELESEEKGIGDGVVAVDMPPVTDTGSDITQGDNLQSLIVTGIDFLQKLGSTLSVKESTKKLVSSFIKKDEKSGKLSINIPISDDTIVEKAVDALDSFFKLFAQKK